jgi:hypothetical protein
MRTFHEFLIGCFGIILKMSLFAEYLNVLQMTF